MKTFTFKYDPAVPGVGKELAASLKKKKVVHPDEMVSRNLKALLEVATASRLRIFEAIVSQRPESMYQLAIKLGMSQSFVLQEARFLEALGLIELKREKVGARERLRPETVYSRVVIDCGFVAHTG